MTDTLASKFTTIPTLSLYLQSNALATLSNGLSAMAANADRKKRGIEFCSLTASEEVACLRAFAIVAAELSRNLAILARDNARAAQ